MRSSNHTPFKRITINPAVLNGQPIIRGTRLSVRRVIEAVALYPDRSELLAEYPGLTDADIEEALRFAALSVADENIDLETA
jgi:uncharacterized protein (DUF433 family)